MTDNGALPSGEMTRLIDTLLQTRDPAVAGLRRIIKTKREQGRAYPCRPLSFCQLDGEHSPGSVLATDERRVLELEREVLRLRGELEEQKRTAQREAARERTRGYEEGVTTGHTRGYEEGCATAGTHVEHLRSRVAGVLDAVEKTRRSMLARAENALVSLSLEIARKVVVTEISQNPLVVAHVVRTALAHVADKEKLTLRISSCDAAVLEERSDFWTPVNEQLDDIRIVCDERIERGGCVIEGPAGVIDARIDVQLMEMRDVVEKQWLAAGVVAREQAMAAGEQDGADRSDLPRSDGSDASDGGSVHG